ncbi:MAG: flagellar basal body P-ring protein FlgI [Kiritimatiellae bacterium]|nr:flagellar basal body P-ring protein FlgI [Kiritimatiellia bacterium]MDD4735534.1 flagellar basal body P-ring protein FlgI [Kiritimatiellia bacterium]
MKTNHYFSRSNTGAARQLIACFAALALLPLGTPSHAAVTARLKDIVRIEGVDEVQLVGYGIVVGLNGSGDKDLELTKQTVANLLEQFRITIPSTDIKSKNTAAVMVTATAPAFHREGDRVNIQVSTMGDATSLEGGILLMTPMLAPDGILYALSQGALTVSGYSSGSGGRGGQTDQMNYTSVGYIPGGAVLRYSQTESFIQEGIIRLALNHADFTTANRLADAINKIYEGSAAVRDASSVFVRVPADIIDIGQTARFMASLESLTIEPDSQSKVIINERSGTIVMGGNVHIAEAVVAHGNLTVRITSNLAGYMPEPFTMTEALVLEETRTQVHEENAKVMLLPGTTTVQELAALLNEVGTTPRDIISILEALQNLGALQMEVQTM